MNEETIFAVAAAIDSPVDRTKYLDEACVGNAGLRIAVERLLELQDSAGSFLEKPPVEAAVAATMLHVDGPTSDDEDEATPAMAKQPTDDDDEISLGYLQPSENPNSLGRLGHYEILEVVGRGAFGTVLRAFDEKLQRVVAIKVLAPEMAATSPARKRFLREARTSAAIRHENVVSIHAVEDDPIPYLVMEYIPGKTLQQRLDERGPLELENVLRLGKQIADGLAAAHAQDLIHRDIKPGNILLEGGVTERVKITDFGLARTADDASLTQSGLIAGTPMYMAPEQALGQKLDQRADLFSFGSVLYQMLSGRPPFRAPSTLAVLKRVAEDQPRPIQEIIPEVPTWICELIGHLHAKRPADRYATAQEVSDLLARCLVDLKAARTPKIPPPHPSAVRKETEMPTVAAELGPIPAGAAQTSQIRPWPKVAAAALLLFGGVTITEATGVTELASTVVRLTTNSGTLVIETDDPRLKVTVDGENVRIHGSGLGELTLKPGRYTVAALQDGQPVKRELVSITRNGRAVVRMSLERASTSVVRTGPDPQPSTLNPRPPLWHGWPADAPPPAIAPFDAEQAKRHQDAWTEYLDVPVEYTNGIGMKFRLIPPGEFLMGSTPEEIEATLKKANGDNARRERIFSEGPQHKVILTQPVYVGVTEVTQAQYEQVMGNNPSHFSATGEGQDAVANLKTGNHPVEMVSWNDAAEFCAKLSQQEDLRPFYFRSGEEVTPLEGTGYRLPTEAEWESACRAGTTTRFWSGDEDQDLLQVGWFGSNSGGRTHPAGELRANPFGLTDVHGNVWDWVQDSWDPAFYGKFQVDAASNPSCQFSAGRQRVFRGGNWRDYPFYCRSSSRNASPPTFRSNIIGFRVVLPVDAVRQTNKRSDQLESKASWTPLFNSKDLTGWKTLPELPGQWEVTDGILKGSSKPSFLFSERGDFANFHLRAELKVNGLGDAGILFRTPFEFRHGPKFWMVEPATGYEAELYDQPNPRGTLWQINPGQQPRLLAEAVRVTDDDDGNWITFEIFANGNHFITRVNGRETVNATDPSSRYHRGHLVLGQFHPNAILQIRKLEIRELPSPPVSDAPPLQHFASDEWIDVIPLIDPQLDKWDMRLTGKNEWQIKDGELAVGNADEKPYKLVLPIDADFWPSFEVELDVTRRSGDRGFNLNFPTVSGDTPLNVDFPTKPGLFLRTPQGGIVSITEHRQLLTGERTTLRVEVRRQQRGDRITVRNGDTLSGTWTGDRTQLAYVNNEGYPHNRRLSLWIHAGSGELIIHRIHLRMLDWGTAKSVRPVSNSQPREDGIPISAAAPLNRP